MTDMAIHQNRVINIFTCITFQEARTAQDTKRQQLQSDPEKRVQHAQPLTASEAREAIEIYSNKNPDGLNRRFFQVKICIIIITFIPLPCKKLCSYLKKGMGRPDDASDGKTP
jgi:hypothetical protein